VKHFDPIGLSGVKERQIFAQIDQSNKIWEKERNHYNKENNSSAGPSVATE